MYDVFRGELREMGYIEGKNLVIDQRSAEGRPDRLPSFLSELIALRPDVIVAVATPAVAAAQSATSTIPIIMAPATDPIGSGFVKSLARPGGKYYGYGQYEQRLRREGRRASPRAPAVGETNCRSSVRQPNSSTAIRIGRNCYKTFGPFGRSRRGPHAW